VYRKSTIPTECAINCIGSDDFFYSNLSESGDDILDKKITLLEGEISLRLHHLKKCEEQEIIDSKISATIFLHLTMRTAHLRSTMAYAFKNMITKLSERVITLDFLESQFGFDRGSPTPSFKEVVRENIDAVPELKNSPLPIDVLERIAFHLARENFSEILVERQPFIHGALELLASRVSLIAREGHNKALESLDNETPHLAFLEELNWRVIGSPAPGLILPDCVGISIDDRGETSPYGLPDQDRVCGVLLPISSDRLLVGAKGDFAIDGSFDVNRALSSCADDYFLAADDHEAFRMLCSEIKSKAKIRINNAIDDAIHDAYDLQNGDSISAGTKLDSDRYDGNHEIGPINFSISISGDDDHVNLEMLGEIVRDLIFRLSKTFSLTSIAGISIASNYLEAVRAVETDLDKEPPAETADECVGIGVARNLNVRREGSIKSYIVFRYEALTGLLSNTVDEVSAAEFLVAAQIAEAAWASGLRKILQELSSKEEWGYYDAWVFDNTFPLIIKYLSVRSASRIIYAYEGVQDSLQIANSAMEHMISVVTDARLDYRIHGNLDKLLDTALPKILLCLLSVANLAAHIHAAEEHGDHNPLEEPVFNKYGLSRWFQLISTDLAEIERRSGRWTSLDEFLKLNTHFERIMWHLGMIPWQEESSIRIELPIGVDVAKLLEIQNIDTKVENGT